MQEIGKGKAIRRAAFIEKAYELFSSGNIESVSLQHIADAAGYGVATLYRYFINKPALVVETATWKWQQTIQWNRERRPDRDREGVTAAMLFAFLLESFLEMYRNQKDLLRFNQFFNIYIQAVHIDAEVMKPYADMIGELSIGFHGVYELGKKDGTLRTDIPEQEMFSTSLHLMLAAATRYAVGLVYQGGNDPITELQTLKDMLMQRYTVSAEANA